MKLTRRKLLTSLACATATGGAWGRRVHAKGDAPAKFLITLGAFGGASIIDSFLAISENEVLPPIGETLNVFPDEEVWVDPQGPFRAVDRSTSPFFGETYVGSQSAFVQAHRESMLVVTQTSTSVNHTIGQQRSLNGNGAWAGRTLPEAVAMYHGAECPLPNVTMGALGYREDGIDDTVESWARAHSVDDPRQWPLALDGLAGIDDAPTREILDLARAVRNERLDPQSKFWQTFLLSDRLQEWKRMREDDLPRLEEAQLLEKLNFGLEHPGLPSLSATDRAALESALGHLSVDPLQMQAAMAYLLIKNGLSVAVTLSPTWNVFANPDAGPGEHRIVNAPLSFDFSHTSHRNTQTMMWQRMLDTVDALITLLDAEPHPQAPGDSLFDHTVIYLATDFGRTKNRPAGSTGFGSGHDLNNGNLLVSGGLLRGNAVLGGVDATTALTYGYDPVSGAPAPGTQMGERILYAGLLQGLQVDTAGSGLPNAAAFLPA